MGGFDKDDKLPSRPSLSSLEIMRVLTMPLMLLKPPSISGSNPHIRPAAMLVSLNLTSWPKARIYDFSVLC